jgi:hypothetical protein
VTVGLVGPAEHGRPKKQKAPVVEHRSLFGSTTCAAEPSRAGWGKPTSVGAARQLRRTLPSGSAGRRCAK